MQGNLTSRDSSNRGHEDQRAPREVRLFFLTRLERLVALRQEQCSRLSPGSPALRLLDKAVYSTFCDCLDLGDEEAARAIIRPKELETRIQTEPEVDPN